MATLNSFIYDDTQNDIYLVVLNSILVYAKAHGKTLVDKNYDPAVDAPSHIIYSPIDLPQIISQGNGQNHAGTADHDTLNGTKDDDSLTGNDGNDILNGKDGNDILMGNKGNDRLNGGKGDDHLDGGEGNDMLIAAQGNNSLIGGEGHDIIRGGNGNDSVDGGEGHDYITTGHGNNQVFAGSGDDIIVSGNGSDFIHAGADNDIVIGHAGNNIILGGDGNDILQGGKDDDAIFAENGHDILRGLNGTDILDGGEGNDLILGGKGDDTLIGGAGNDTLFGNEGNDIATYSGKRYEYHVTHVGFGIYLIEDSVAGRDGFDIVQGIELFRFSDADVTEPDILTPPPNQPPVVLNQTFLISEHADASTLIGTVVASDPEQDTLTYSLVTPSQFFEIDPNTGAITLLQSGVLDYESLPHHTLQVKVTDSHNQSTEVEIQISLTDANDAPTHFFLDNPADLTIAETQSSGEVIFGDLTVNDPDAAGTPFNDYQFEVYEYSAGDYILSTRFAAQNGKLVLLSGTQFDYETQASINLRILATDGENLHTIHLDLTIDVLNQYEAATAVNDSAATLEDNSITVDVLANDITGTPDAVITQAAIINGGLGSVSITQDNKLFYDPQGSYNFLKHNETQTVTIQYEITNQDGATDIAELVLTIQGTNDIPVVTPLNFATNENTPISLDVVAAAFDADFDNLVLTNADITQGPGFGTLNIQNNQIYFDPGADFTYLNTGETVAVNITYTLSDGTSSVTGSATLEVNGLDDVPPEVPANQTFNVDENSQMGTVVGAVAASTAMGGNLHYAFPRSTPVFEINSQTGEITIGSFTPDFEMQSAYSLEVEVTDDFGNSSTSFINIHIGNINEAPVLDDTSVTIPENLAIGELVIDLDAFDPDVMSIFNQLTYSILNGNQDGIFSINALTGAISILDNANLDFGTLNDPLQLVVQVSDASDPNLFDTAIITINVTNVDTLQAINDEYFITGTQTYKISDVIPTSPPNTGEPEILEIVFDNSAGSNVIYIRFNEMVNGADNLANYQIVSLDPLMVPPQVVPVDLSNAQVSFDPITLTATLDLGAAVDKENLIYALETQNLTDSDNHLVPQDFSAVIYDQEPPVVYTTQLNANQIEIIFDGAVNKATAENTANYQFTNGKNILSATLTTVNGVDTVVLTVEEEIQPETDTLLIANVADLAGNTIATTDANGNPIEHFILSSATPLEITGAFLHSQDASKIITTFNGDITTQNLTELSKYHLFDDEGNELDLSTATLSFDAKNNAVIIDLQQNINTQFFLVVDDIDPNGSQVSLQIAEIFSPPSVTQVTKTADNQITITFNSLIDATLAENIQNYQVNGLDVLNATLLNTSPASVVLTLSGNVEVAQNEVTISGLQDIFGNALHSIYEGQVLHIPVNAGLLNNDLDENSAITAVLVDNPAHGTLQLSPDGSFTYHHDGSDTTTDTFTYYITDGTSNSNTATVTLHITPVNDAPTANPDSYQQLEDQILITDSGNGLLANDIDPEQSPLSITTVQSLISGSQTHAVVYGDPIMLSSGALLTIHTDGSFQYNQNSAFNHLQPGEKTTEIFTYTISDGSGGFSTGQVNIEITGINDAPFISNLDGDAQVYRYGSDMVALDLGNDALIIEPDSTNFLGAHFTLSFNGTMQAGDELLINGNIPVSQTNPLIVITFDPGNAIFYQPDQFADKIQIGTFDGGLNGEDLNILFNANANIFSINALLQTLSFRNTSGTTTTLTRDVTVTFTDADGTLNGGQDSASTTVAITSVVAHAIIGTENSDVLVGTNDDDVIVGLAQDDTITGDPGFNIDDINNIFTTGNDNISGGLGADMIYGEAQSLDLDLSNFSNNIFTLILGDDTIYGNEGDDTIYASYQTLNIDSINTEIQVFLHLGNDTIYGGEGNDTIYADTMFYNSPLLVSEVLGSQSIFGEAGDDVIHIGHINSMERFIDGGSGQDTLVIENFATGMMGKPLSSTEHGELALNDNIITNIETILTLDDQNLTHVWYGTDQSDMFTAHAGRNIYAGGNGIDTVDYSLAPNALQMGIGSDNGYGEVDTLLNIERIIGTSHDDFIAGDLSNTLFNYFELGDGADVLVNVSSKDPGPNIVYAEYSSASHGITVDFTQTTTVTITNPRGDSIDFTGNLVLDDGLGNQDILVNVQGIIGSAFADSIIGSDNAEIFDGRGGDDMLTGGAGSDRFIFNIGDGADTITDFSTDASGAGSESDILDLHGIDIEGDNANEQFANLNITHNGSDTVINFDDGDSITLVGVTDLAVDDINFSTTQIK